MPVQNDTVCSDFCGLIPKFLHGAWACNRLAYAIEEITVSVSVSDVDLMLMVRPGCCCVFFLLCVQAPSTSHAMSTF